MRYQARVYDIAGLWKESLSNKAFTIRFLAGVLILLYMLYSFPTFFAYIELREGIQFHDRLLHAIPATDVSIPTFIIIWSMSSLWLLRCIQDPSAFLLAIFAFTLLCLCRMLTITLIPLNPPAGLIPLKDPISSFFYGGTGKFITKDLFFSGHTSIQFLIFLCLDRKRDKLAALIATFAVGTLVLVQHVHYTVDVLGAFIITYPIYRISKRIAAF